MTVKNKFVINELTKDAFEDLIDTGFKLKEIMTYFGVEYNELDNFVREHYNGLQLEFVYKTLRQKSLQEYIDTLKLLAIRGNSTALQTLNQYVYDFKEEEEVQKIQIVGGIPDVGDTKGNS